MWSYLLPTITEWKKALPHFFASKSRRTMWAIGVLVLSLTVTTLSAQPNKTVEASYEKTKSPDSKNSSIRTVESSNQVNITQPPSQPQTQAAAIIDVNNQSISVPPNSSVHKTIQSDDGQTKLNVSIDASSTDNQSTSSSSVQLNVRSEQETTIENSE